MSGVGACCGESCSRLAAPRARCGVGGRASAWLSLSSDTGAGGGGLGTVALLRVTAAMSRSISCELRNETHASPNCLPSGVLMMLDDVPSAKVTEAMVVLAVG